MKKGTKTVLAAGAAVGAGALLKNQLTDNPSPVGSYGGTDIYRTPEEQLTSSPIIPHRSAVMGARISIGHQKNSSKICMIIRLPRTISMLTGYECTTSMRVWASSLCSCCMASQVGRIFIAR